MISVGYPTFLHEVGTVNLFVVVGARFVGEDWIRLCMVLNRNYEID